MGVGVGGGGGGSLITQKKENLPNPIRHRRRRWGSGSAGVDLGSPDLASGSCISEISDRGI